MKILIIGPLGAGKSSLSYNISQKYGFKRLNLDEVCRMKDGKYRDEKEQFLILNDFLEKNQNWVMEGCQKTLYEKVNPDLIVDMRIWRIKAMVRFTLRFFKAKKLIGKDIAPELPVQAYHYRKITLSKILEWDLENKKINKEIKEFLKNVQVSVLTCKGFKDYPKVFAFIDKDLKK